MRLTPRQLADYERDGFLVVERFVDEAACDALMARARELVEEFDPQGVVSVFTTREQARASDRYFMESGNRISFFFEEDAFDVRGVLRQSKARSINKIGHALHDLDPIFDGFSRAPALAQLVASLGTRQPLLVQSMYIFKQPGIGGEVTCHQDSTFLYTEPPSVIGLWFALEDATLENGCLRAIPGGHRRGLKSRFVRAQDGDDGGGARFEVFDAEPWPEQELVPVEVPKGTLVVLDGLLPHMSKANRSPRSRQAYTLHVIDGAATYPTDNWLRRRPSMPFRGF